MRTLPGYAIARESVLRFISDDCFSMAGALAYYTLFSLPGLLVIAITLSGFFFGEDAARGEVRQQAQRLLGDQAAMEIESMVLHAADSQSRGLAATLMGLASLLFGATGVFVQLQSSLDKVWHVEPDPRQGGVRNFIQKRLLSFGLVMGLGFLLLASLVVSAAIAAFSNLISGWLNNDASAMFVDGMNAIVSLVVVTVIFAAIFKVMPDAQLHWHDVWLGAATTSLLFAVGKYAIGFYIGNTDLAGAYGAAGSLAVVLIWIYYSSVILLGGAEFTRALCASGGEIPAPEPGAAKVIEQKTHGAATSAAKKTG